MCKSAVESISLATPSSKQATRPPGESQAEKVDQPSGTGAARPSGSTSAAEPPKENAAEQSDYTYACFLMQCLTELLFSYEACTTAFLSYSRKKGSSKESGSRPKSTALVFLLSELVSFGAFNIEPKFDAHKRIMWCN